MIGTHKGKEKYLIKDWPYIRWSDVSPSPLPSFLPRLLFLLISTLPSTSKPKFAPKSWKRTCQQGVTLQRTIEEGPVVFSSLLPPKGSGTCSFFLKETQFQGCITRRLNCTNVHTFGLLMPKGLSRRRSEMNFWFQISSDEFMAMCSLRHSDVTWLSHCQRLCVANATFVYMSRFTCVFIFRQKKCCSSFQFIILHTDFCYTCFFLVSASPTLFWLVVHQVWIWEERFT